MKRSLVPGLITSIITLLLFSCYYDSKEALYPTIDTTCDTTLVTYKLTIVPILSNNCYSCHSISTAAANGDNIRLETYSDVVANSARVTPAIKHTGSVSPMPKNGSKISSCSITQWDIWVRNGMINN
jgi:hypothetical protein